VTEPEDPFDTWLHGQLEPLRPPPGTFNQIRKRAQRRKMRRAMMSAASAGAAAALIVIAVVAVPKLVPSLHGTPKPAANSTLNRPTFSPSQHPTTPATTTPMSSAATSSGAPTVPADFAPTSVTFINFYDGYVLGQAANCGATYCTSMAETSNYGKSWAPVTAPPTGAPDGSVGVSQVRFIDPDHGWAFGPQLYQTDNGGQSWQLVNTDGMRVTGLEAVGSMAYAVFAQCSGSGTSYGADCTHVSLYSSPVGSDAWTPMANLQGLGFNRGYVSGKIVLTHGEGYFYAPDGLLYGGSTSQGATWAQLGSTALACQPANGSADGEPTGGQLAASAAGDLALACPGSAGSGQEDIYTSVDNGLSWQEVRVVTVAGSPTSLAAGTSGVLTLSTTGGIYTSQDNGAHWSQALQGPAGGFSYVGLTSATQGVAVPAEPAQSNSVWFTYDGAKRWHQSSIKNS
jgi:hypothetical protein